jgi:uncharacterized metal-binding protein
MAEAGGDYEAAHIERTRRVCPMCEDYAARQAGKPVAVLCCEGACLRGEVARQAANLLCHTLRPGQTVRICLGGAFTKDTGQRSLVKRAPSVIALEGCFLNCASRMMRGVIPDLAPEVVVADRLYDFDRQLFGIDEMPAADIARHARTVAEQVAATLAA